MTRMKYQGGHQKDEENDLLLKLLQKARITGGKGERVVMIWLDEKRAKDYNRQVVCSSSRNTHYTVDGDALESEFESAGFADSAVGLAWEGQGQSRYL